MARITLQIETEDLSVLQKVSAVLNGEAPQPEPAAEAPKPEPAEAVNTAEAPAPTPEPVPQAVETAADVATAPGAAGVDLDADGLPWDARIHAGTKTKKADGKWKAKRNVDPELVKQVEAELRQVMAIPDPTSATTAAEPETAAPATAEPAPAPTATPAPSVTPPEPAPTATEQVSNVSGPTTFMELVGAIGSGGYGQAAINDALGRCNPPLPSFQALANRSDLIPAFWEQLAGA